MNTSDSIVNSYFSETLCIMHAKAHILIHTNSPFPPIQRNYIWFPQSNRLSDASGLLYMLFPLPRISFNLPLSLLSFQPSSGHIQTMPSKFPFSFKTYLLETLNISQSAHPLIATTLSISLLFCTPKLPYTYLGYKIYHTDTLLCIHPSVFFFPLGAPTFPSPTSQSVLEKKHSGNS